MTIDLRNVQGLATELYRRRLSRHLFFQVGDRAGGQSFVRGVTPLLTDGPMPPPGTPLVNLTLTCGGLRTLRPDWPLDQCETAFLQGPDADTLGDAPGSSSEEARWWEQQFTTADIGCLLHVYGDTVEQLDERTATIRTLAAAGSLRELTPRQSGATLDGAAFAGGRLHFGYIDGLSKVPVAWDETRASDITLDPRHVVLGYADDATQSFPRRGPFSKTLADSSYVIFRWIYQDVAAFNRYLAAAGAQAYPALPAADAQELVAAKMMGRFRDGTPLALSDRPGADVPINTFTFGDDPKGLKCPLTSHIRVVNPRDQPLDALAAIDGVPRILRRGMPYGPWQDGVDDDGVDRGIIGLFVCSNIQRQFITMMRWIKETSFSPAFPDLRAQDAIAGNRGVRDASRRFDAPTGNGRPKYPPLPDFLRTKGTAYLLLPSFSTLRALVES